MLNTLENIVDYSSDWIKKEKDCERSWTNIRECWGNTDEGWIPQGSLCYLRIQFWELKLEKSPSFCLVSCVKSDFCWKSSDALVQYPKDLNWSWIIHLSQQVWNGLHQIMSAPLDIAQWIQTGLDRLLARHALTCVEQDVAPSILCSFYRLVSHPLNATCSE